MMNKPDASFISNELWVPRFLKINPTWASVVAYRDGHLHASGAGMIGYTRWLARVGVCTHEYASDWHRFIANQRLELARMIKGEGSN